MAKTTPKDAALAQLVNFGVPTPTDFVPHMELPSALFFMRDLATAIQERAVVFFGEMAQVGDEVDDMAALVFNGVSACMAGSTHALVALGMLPQEAEDGMTEALK